MLLNSLRLRSLGSLTTSAKHWRRHGAGILVFLDFRTSQQSHTSLPRLPFPVRLSLPSPFRTTTLTSVDTQQSSSLSPSSPPSTTTHFPSFAGLVRPPSTLYRLHQVLAQQAESRLRVRTRRRRPWRSEDSKRVPQEGGEGAADACQDEGSVEGASGVRRGCRVDRDGG